MIYLAPEPAVPIPDVDFASYVLAAADSFRDRPALIDADSGNRITYGQLQHDVHAMAAGLRSRGYGSGDTLGIYMPNMPEYAVVFLAACRAGLTCTPVNPLYTADELAAQLTGAGARILVTVPEHIGAAEKAGVEELFVVGGAPGASPLSDLAGDPSEAAPLVDPGREYAALPYSSGTTGRSKGVMLTHRNLVAELCQMQACFPISPTDTLIGVLPFFHIFGLMMVLGMGLRNGATVVTMPRFGLGAFLRQIEENQVTVAHVVPPILLMIARDPTVSEYNLSSLRALQCGGAPLAPEVAAEAAARAACPVLEGYGLTETSSATHVNRPGSGALAGSIGQPLPGTECRLVDPDTGAEALPGERGELWIRGAQVMSGYLGDDTATATTIDEDGWLHTGDIATADVQARFRIVDRLKELIKYNGYQVAPAELEALILGHPEIADVAVVGVPDERAGELPCAFVVANTDSVDPEALLEWVAERVSPQKRIRQVELLDAIPRSASGKILRRALPGVSPPRSPA